MPKTVRRDSHGDYYLDLVLQEDDEEEAPFPLVEIKSTKLDRKIKEQTTSNTAYIFIPPIENKSNNVHIKVPPNIQKKITRPEIKRYLISIKYDYPFVIFPQTLEEELAEIQDFFDIKARGSGSVVHSDKMVSVLSYRVAFDIVKTRCFSRVITEILERYGIEIISSEIIRIK